MNILMIGDIAAKAGMHAVRKVLPKLIADRQIDFVVANGENVAGGIGITPEYADELFSLGVNVITSGNHIWRQREIRSYIDAQPRLLRPLNFVKGQPGKGDGIFETLSGVTVGVLNLSGQVFMGECDSPFTAADEAMARLGKARIILVDFHAEVTSEKRAMGFHLDGRVTAVIGTHTHVQTADEQVLPGGTGFLTDVGMTGPHDSVIGMRKDLVLEKFRTGLYQSFKPATGGIRFQGVVITADAATGKAQAMERVDIPVQPKP